MTADLRNSLPEDFTLRDVLDLTRDASAVRLTPEQNRRLYGLIQDQLTSSVPHTEGRGIKWRGLRILAS